MTARAQWETKGSYVNNEFGREYAKKIFKLTDEELEALVGRYSRGPRKGLLRGYLTWYKTTKGGWVKTGSYDWDAQQGTGFIVKPNLTFGHSLQVNGKVVAGLDEQAERTRRSDPVLEALKEACGRGKKPMTQEIMECERDIYADLWADMSDDDLCLRYGRQCVRVRDLASKEDQKEDFTKAVEVLTSMMKAVGQRNLNEQALAASRLALN